jgi:DNA-binding protein H-NS
MSILQDLLAQRAAIEAKIMAVQLEGRTKGIAQIRELMSENGLTMSDITGRSPGAANAPADREARVKKPAPIKYRNAATGESWTGRGLKPKWMTVVIADGATADEFKV